MKKIIIALLIVLVLAGAGLYAYYLYAKTRTPDKILTFEDCANAGNLVVETIPRECHTKEGTLYIEEDNHKALTDYILVTVPAPNSKVKTPFKVEGKARGSWYKNNRLKLKVVNYRGEVLFEKEVFALSDTSKDKFVEFVAAVNFTPPADLERGKLLIEKTSGTDDPGKNGPLIIPLRF